MTIYYFVRHGSTNDSGKRITGYIPGVELNNEGRQQARRIAEYFASITLTAIYSSPLERAIETAEQVGYKKSITIQPISFLKEINFGCYQGRGEDLRGDTLWETFLNFNPCILIMDAAFQFSVLPACQIGKQTDCAVIVMVNTFAKKGAHLYFDGKFFP